MKTIDQWLTEYSKDHQNPTNKKIHHICVPLIMLSLFGLLWSIPTPNLFTKVPFLNWATLLALGALIFYARLSMKATLFMLFNVLIQFTLIYQFAKTGLLLQMSLGVFIVAWIGQFIGHKIEGQKPSFFEDLQFLLIGPLWVFKRFFL